MRYKMDKRTIEAALKQTFGFGLMAILTAFAIKWAIYSAYVKHSCDQRTLLASWKNSSFCVNSGELRVWHGIAYAETALAVLLAATVIAGLMCAFLERYRGD